MTGVAAALELQTVAKREGLNIDVQLVEASNRLGGKIDTIVRDGFVIERGPDSFLERKKSATKLAQDVGLGDKLTFNGTGKSYVLVNEKLHSMPEGATMGIPTQILPFVYTGLFSPIGKLRAAFDFVLPKTEATSDLSLGAFFRRRLGDEVVENLIEPLLSGIYAGDIDQLSLMATFPNFWHIEQKYGSLVLGMKKAMPPAPKLPAGTKKQGIFQTVTTGLQSLVDAVEAQLEEGTVRKNTRVTQIERHGEQYTLHIADGESIVADAIILAAPHPTVPAMFPQYSFFEPLVTMPSTSVATVAMAFNESAITKDIDGTGFVVSRNSDYTITACTWTHKKWPHTTPKGKVLLRCYVGRAGDEAIVDRSDDEIVAVVLRDLRKTMDITEEPLFSIVSRWRESMPQYTVGHKERIAEMKRQLASVMPSVILAGASYEGLGLPDCIDQGHAAVKVVVEQLKAKETMLV